MKKNKGFTLVELLAVIVILAVIALIATPQILKLINDSRENSAEDSMYGYIKAVEQAYVKEGINSETDYSATEYKTLSKSAVSTGEGADAKALTIDVKGSEPNTDSNNVLYINNERVVECAKIKFNNRYNVYYDGNEAHASTDAYTSEQKCPITPAGGEENGGEEPTV